MNDQRRSAIKWPDHFPNDCPPPNAYSDEFVVYRLVNNNPPSDEDFLSHKILGKADGCQACGISLSKDLNNIKKSLNNSPALRKRWKFIAKGIVTKDSGVIMETPSQTNKSHITWWVYPEVRACTMFEIQLENN